MPGSFSIYNSDILSTINDLKIKTIFDVGIGKGKFFNLTKNINIERYGCEIDSSYINKYKLNIKYKKIFNEDYLQLIRNNKIDIFPVDMIIFSDVIEHFLHSEVYNALDYSLYNCQYIIVINPIFSIQNKYIDENGNHESEIHKSKIKLTDLCFKYNIITYKNIKHKNIDYCFYLISN